MTANDLRKKFLDFFAGKGHKIIPSDSLVPADDPTVLFTSAGMNQFKRQFLGLVTDFRKAATCQKCLRTDDLDKVGKTPFHHTFFEMLGNFSFGDYFKKEAITWAWEFLTQTLKIPKEKLWVSVFVEDDEAYKIWKDTVGVAENKIIKLGDRENFWPAQAKTKGPNGPCGPCSEIFFDYGSKVGCGKSDCSPACDCGRFSEVWNLVFTQFNRKEGGVLEPLPHRNIDTGMGLERLAAVMQRVLNNFETDLFVPILRSISKEAERLKANIILSWLSGSGRTLADHMRAVVFAIGDGVLPSNEDRGYVVRKLIRRCAMLAREAGVEQVFLYKLVPAVAEVMKEPYPELARKREDIAQIVRREEEAFEKILNEEIPQLKEKMKDAGLKYKANELSRELGKIAFAAYDTSGVPIVIVQSLAQELKQPSPDLAVFNSLMEEQKNRSKAASSMAGDVFTSPALKLDLKPTDFVGYSDCASEARVAKIVKNDSAVKEIKVNDQARIILDATPFYAESGGQVGDTGIILKDHAKMEVLDTQKIEKAVIHLVKVTEGSFKEGDKVKAMVNTERRLSIARNHTATHLLQAALRQVLGEHVQQQGSLVSADKLRFDFTHFKDIDKEQLGRIEELVNEYIRSNDLLAVDQKPLEKARQSGALAYFAEKYEQVVRVVSIGKYSAELCGGTHLTSTGQIGLFKIISESSIAQGIRRMEAVTGAAAYGLVRREEELITEVAQTLKVPEDKVLAQIQKLVSSMKDSNKKLNALKMESLKNSVSEIISDSPQVKGTKIVTYKFSDCDFDFLRKAVDLFKSKVKSAAIILGSVYEEKALLVAGLTDDLVKNQMDASQIIKEIAQLVGGSGGGRPSLAQAGGNLCAKLDEALKKAVEIVKQKAA